MSLIYYLVCIPLLLAVASFAVDFGRVELAKTEMRGAVDAAARAACAYIPTDLASARSAAIAAASSNTVDGVPLELRSQDIEFGLWKVEDKTFDPGSSSPNAVRIWAYRTNGRSNPIPLHMSQVMGISTRDISTHQITMAIPSSAWAFVGLDGIAAKNNLFVSSYNSAVTTNPSKSNHAGAGSVSSNGAIAGKNNDTIWGKAVVGPAGSVLNIQVTQGITYESKAVAAPSSPAWTPQSNPGGIAQTYTSSGNATLPGGTYWFTALDVSGTLTFSGKTTMYINGNADINGNLWAQNRVPSNLKIYVIGEHNFGNTKNNHTDIIADIEAPNANFYTKNNLVFRGRMFFRTMEFKNNAELFYDEAIGNLGAPAVITVE